MLYRTVGQSSSWELRCYVFSLPLPPCLGPPAVFHAHGLSHGHLTSPSLSNQFRAVLNSKQ